MTHEFAPGALIAGKYQIERTLGEGGMGLVLQARHTQLGQSVAIKVIRPEVTGGNEMSQRFQREAWAAATLTSEHVVRVFDVGVLPSGAPFMVMEYVEGQDLARLVASRGPLPWTEAVGYVLEACVGLAEAHAHGIIHRDLKPSNLFLAKQSGNTWRIKVLDFGVAKAPAERAATAVLSVASLSGAPVGLTGVKMLGTPYYMAPEQFRSARDVDVRADVWSMGVILFDLLTGAPPFTGNTLDQLISSMSAGAPSVRIRRTDVPEELAQIIRDCLQPDPARRIPTIGRLATALARLLPSHTALAERTARVLGEDPTPSLAMAATAHAPVFTPNSFATTGVAPPPSAGHPSQPGYLSQPFASSPSLGAGTFSSPAITAVPVAPPSAGVPAWLLGLLGVGGLTVVGLVLVVGYMFTRQEPAPIAAPASPAGKSTNSQVNTEPLPAGIDRQRVDMLKLYPIAQKMALSRDSNARLINIAASKMNAGLVNLDEMNANVSYLFESRGTSSAVHQTIISASSIGITIFQVTNASSPSTPVADPKCSPVTLWQTVSPREPEGQLNYSAYPTPTGMTGCWQLIAKGTPQRVFDNVTCHEVKY